MAHRTVEVPVSLDPALGDALDRVAGAARLLVAVDFDGTIAPFAPDPSAVRPRADAVDALLALAGLRDTLVAVVSGRSLARLDAVAQLPRSIQLVGSHGAEHGAEAAPLDAVEQQVRADLVERFEALAGGVPGAWVERKPVGVSFHTRLMPNRDDAARLAEAARQVGRDAGAGVVVRDGHEVVELSVRPDTKGDAVARLRASHAADGVVYIGDDVTDEDAFAALRPDEVGVKVGPGATRARFRVMDEDEVVRVLDRLARERRRRWNE